MCSLRNGRLIVIGKDGSRMDTRDYDPNDTQVPQVEANAEQDDVDSHDFFDFDLLDQSLVAKDTLHFQRAFEGRCNRDFHLYSHRGHKYGFGNGERHNPKRRRWNINRRNAARAIARQRGL